MGNWDFKKVLHKVPYVGTWYLYPVKYGHDNSKCQPCFFNVANAFSNSQKNDFMMTLMMKNLVGFIPLIRVLHTVQTKANKIFFIDHYTIENMDKHEKELSVNCGATLINLGFVKLPSNKDFYPYFRWSIYYDFLFSLQRPIHRILVYDGQDTIFQGDPFFKDFRPDNLYITVEDYILKESEWAKVVYKDYLENFTEDSKEWNSPMINAGIIAGGYEPMVRLMYIFLTNIDMENIYSIKSIDQAILTRMVVKGELAKIPYKTKFLTIDDEYTSISVGCVGDECMKKYPKKIFRIGEYQSRTRNITTLIVHQFDRYPLFTKTYLKACPRNGANSTKYMRGMIENNDISHIESLIDKGLI